MEAGVVKSADSAFLLLWKAFLKMKALPEEVRRIKRELGDLRQSTDEADKEAEAESDDRLRAEKKLTSMQSREELFLKEDVIEKYDIRIENVPPPANFFCKAVHCFRTLIPLIQIAYQVECIRGKNSQELRSSTSEENQRNSSHHYLSDLETQEEVFGLVGPTKELRRWLKDGGEERTVITVVGIPGVGKTALAKHVFYKVHDDFVCHAVIRVSQRYTVEGLLRDMIRKLCKERKEDPPSNISEMARDSLEEKVRNLLHKKRYVILFDDVWNENFWKDIQSALFDNKNKSRIIITTRKERVAEFCKTSSIVKVYNLEKPLSEEESLKLLHKKARYGSDGNCPNELKDVSLEILRKCKGLPLAIVFVGGLLSQLREQSEPEWRNFIQNFSNRNLNGIAEIIGFSYDDLPINLRSCLLYFGMYPEGYEIKSDRLVRQWVAEGFVTSDIPKSLEEVANEYLLGLVQRNLVQVSSISFEEKFIKCRVHDLIHDMIRRKVKNSCFGEYIGGGHDQSESSGLVRRLTIATNDVIRSTQTSFIRSIIIIGKQKESWFIQLESKILKHDMPLKVLDYEDSGLPCVPKRLGKLIYLRYLSFRGTPIESLPKSIGKLLNLETLDIRETKVCKIPKEITKLRKLRHLLTPKCVSSSIEWKDIGGMTMLQKIPQVRMEFDEVAIREVGKLKQLRDLRVLYFNGEHNNVLCSSIAEMEHLQALCIKTSGNLRQEVVDLNNTTLPNSKLKKLFLDMKLERLPNWIPQLRNLERLTLCYSDLTKDQWESLKDMRSLMVLSLTHAYKDEKLDFLPGRFPKLRKLILSNLSNLTSIVIHDDTSLPSLEYFELTCLEKLKSVPEGIQHLKKLKCLDVPSMPTEFVEEIDRIGKNQHWTINYGLYVIRGTYSASLDFHHCNLLLC
ncbi:hypothetical protein VNO80_30173 [Phaseolus coccineus]|uniref:NB-ARC domain-containing protein n=1 Tax=Phaseolus coccineus TaxID=3886 RepID=A0AAN9LCS0_PHACN